MRVSSSLLTVNLPGIQQLIYQLMHISEVLESCLYAVNLTETGNFYTDVIGLEVISREKGRHIFFRCGQGVVLLFNPEHTRAQQTTVGDAPIPLHGSMGEGHLAFSVPDEELPEWRERLVNAGIKIESEVEWPGGGRSLYVRDPAGNSIEFASPTIWGLPDESS